MKEWQFVDTTASGVALLSGACSGGNGGSGNSDLKGEARGDDSSTIASIVEKLNEEWAQDHSDAKISAGQADAGAGFQKFIAGDIDFAGVSRPIKNEEEQKLQDKSIKYKESKIAQDGVTVAVNKENDFVDELDKQQLRAIYSGEAKTWKDVNSKWPDKKIDATSPNSSHGTYDFFENEVVSKEDVKTEKNTDISAIASSVTKDKERIGYFGCNFYVQNKDKLEEVKIEDENGKATEPTKKAIQDNSYTLSRPLFICVNEKTLKGSKIMSEFIKFVLEDKGKAAKGGGYVAAPEKTYRSQLDDLKAFTGKNQESGDKKSDDRKSEDEKQ